MLFVTHVVGLARDIADRVIFMDQGQILKQNDPDVFLVSQSQIERSASLFSDKTGSSMYIRRDSSSFCQHLGHRLLNTVVSIDAVVQIIDDRVLDHRM